jgi:hypothetical protein
MGAAVAIVPSVIAKLTDEYVKFQANNENFFRNYRPIDAIPFPACLMYEGFGRLLDAYELSSIGTGLSHYNQENNLIAFIRN